MKHRILSGSDELQNVVFRPEIAVFENAFGWQRRRRNWNPFACFSEFDLRFFDFVEQVGFASQFAVYDPNQAPGSNVFISLRRAEMEMRRGHLGIASADNAYRSTV